MPIAPGLPVDIFARARGGGRCTGATAYNGVVFGYALARGAGRCLGPTASNAVLLGYALARGAGRCLVEQLVVSGSPESRGGLARGGGRCVAYGTIVQGLFEPERPASVFQRISRFTQGGSALGRAKTPGRKQD